MASARNCFTAATIFIAAIVYADQRDDRLPHERRDADWRREALTNLRTASSEHLIQDAGEIARYRSAGFNALVVFDVEGSGDTSWIFKSEDRIREETDFARTENMPLIIGLAVQPFSAPSSESSLPQHRPFAAFTATASANAMIPAATDDAIIARASLWKKYGDDIVLGVFPWYDDVFAQHVDVERQRHVYRLIKSAAPHFAVFGMIGDFGFDASDDDVAHLYDPSSFDHLIVLMYPYDLGAIATGVKLDHDASSDPDGDVERYVDRYVDRMKERFFARLRRGQVLLFVVQAFYYDGDADGRRPRSTDIDIMTQRSGEAVRRIGGQQDNYSIAYFYWGGNASIIGISQRPDWLASVARVNSDLDRQRADRSR
jgi:hypothetical protein